MNKDSTLENELQELISDCPPSYADYMLATATAVERRDYIEHRNSYQIQKRLSQSGQSVADRGEACSCRPLHIRESTPKPSNIPAIPGGQSWGGTVEFWPKGRLARIKLDTVHRRPGVEFSPYDPRPGVPASVANDRADNPRKIGGKRGVVVGFSKHSRRRLLREFGKIDRGYLPTLFTLTFADDQWTDDPEQWKRALKSFYDKARAHFGKFCGFWRLELVDRKSGAKKGEFAPHFHVILFLNVDKGRKYRMNKAQLEDTRAWCDKAWGRGRTQVEPVRTPAGVTIYLAKYVAKSDGAETLAAYPEGIGRVWGKWGSEKNEETGKLELPVISEMVTWYLPYEEAIAMMRAFKRKVFCEGKGEIIGVTPNGKPIRADKPLNDRGYPSLYCFVDAETFVSSWGDMVEHELKEWAASVPVEPG